MHKKEFSAPLQGEGRGEDGLRFGINNKNTNIKGNIYTFDKI
jgi:hypothetical protein